MGHEIRRRAIHELNYLASSVCWCTVLLEGVGLQVKQSQQVCESYHIERFFVAAVVNL